MIYEGERRGNQCSGATRRLMMRQIEGSRTQTQLPDPFELSVHIDP